jgi:hypothetical protein
MSLAPVLVASGCCHTANEPPPPEKFVPIPTAAARTGFENMRASLQGEEVDGEKSPLGQALVKKLNELKAPNAFADLEAEFIKNLRCKKLGCYAELTAEKPEKALRINEFVTSAGSPLGQWASWRFVSGMYEAGAADQARGADQQRRVAVAILDRRSYPAPEVRK